MQKKLKKKKKFQKRLKKYEKKIQQKKKKKKKIIKKQKQKQQQTKKNKTKQKKEAYRRAAFRNVGLRRARRRGKERQALPVRQGFSLGSNTPAPRWGTANLIRSARSPYPRETPQSEFRRPTVYPGNLPAEPDKPRQDPDGTDQKNHAKS